MTTLDQREYRQIHYWIAKTAGKASYCSNDKTHISKRYHWANISGKYTRDINDYKPLCPSCHGKMDFTEGRREKLKGNHNRRRAVIQKSRDGVYIRTFVSIKEAAETTNILKSTIINVLNGRGKTAGGYLWEYH